MCFLLEEEEEISPHFSSVLEEEEEGGDEEKEKEAEEAEEAKPEEPKERKVPAELIKFWKAVQDDPKDFTGWTYLLQGLKTHKITKTFLPSLTFDGVIVD